MRAWSYCERVWSYCESIELVPLECIDDFQLANVGRDEDLFPVTAELDPSPLSVGKVLPHMKCGKGSLRRYSKMKHITLMQLMKHETL